MAKPTENKQYPLRHYVNIMFLISFIVLILDFAISISAISIVKQQATRYLQDTAGLYLDRINHDFAYINHYTGWTLANDESLKAMTTSPMNSREFFEANENLHKRFTELQKNYGQEYNFFVYLKKQSFFLNCAPISISYSDYQALKEQIIANARQDRNVYEKLYSKWTPVRVNGKFYITNIVPYYDSYMISLVSADNLIRPLREINLGENGFVSLIAENGQSITSPVSNRGQVLNDVPQASSSPGLFQAGTTVNGQFTNATFHVKLVIQFGTFEKIMIAQLLILLLAVIITCSLGFILLYFRNKVLRPIKNFSYNLAFWTEEGEPLEFQGSKIIELEKANKQFLNLIGQIKKFKIDLYERELEKQRIQLDYMKLQIKPHFFLNCLTSIYSMAQMQMHEEIERMALSTAKYFRYIFQNDGDFVKLGDEIEHVRIYLEIQQHRYQNALAYRIEQEENLAETEIPPLVLQTFVENAVKYAVSRVAEARIELAAGLQLDAGEERLVIRISDTGPGFPPDILEKLQSGVSLEQTAGTRIGIMNTLQRLDSLYDKQAAVSFFNKEDGGACVILSLPANVAAGTNRSVAL
ncbi:MAG: histidine kinase [Paenibacillus macerans]|uniref:Histidine kinase family protein n=1 Tax=Paenibacillus macerans TaxID=44252 RepID=A0A090ZJS7_PAEMA|nr:sensor histidine kinase [Paenibacillus macerans]KFN10520.1 histidine kinase family protein [Paenibacillus macerans]MBS5912255.1 histidine kinase [Paenibacillus macerans]MCY7557111.1 histidine kinase [Paenibacillus macerans]MDU7476039.1 histidine kinase [Paenibacillus macerans]MEC0139432.1 histidine kinase [Paenibacillus macerans]